MLVYEPVTVTKLRVSSQFFFLIFFRILCVSVQMFVLARFVCTARIRTAISFGHIVMSRTDIGPWTNTPTDTQLNPECISKADAALFEIDHSWPTFHRIPDIVSVFVGLESDPKVFPGPKPAFHHQRLNKCEETCSHVSSNPNQPVGFTY